MEGESEEEEEEVVEVREDGSEEAGECEDGELLDSPRGCCGGVAADMMQNDDWFKAWRFSRPLTARKC